MKKIFIPWSLDGYINGNHPLINSYLIFIKANFEVNTKSNIINYESANEFTRNNLQYVFSKYKDKAPTAIEYLSSRNNLSYLYQPVDSVALHHSIMPNICLPSIIHFETPLTLFIPFLSHGKFSSGLSLKNHPMYPYIYEDLMSKNIKFIFTHSRLGYENFKKLFADPQLHQKLHYIPAESFVNDFVSHHRNRQNLRFLNPLINLRNKLRPNKFKREKINILFTSSYHSGENTFWLRGGAIALKSFANICDHYSASLDFVGKIPKDLPQELMEIVSRSNVTTHEFLSDHDLQRLYDKCHILLSPTVGLHAMSLLRAICSNVFVISSNAPGVSDLVNHANYGIVVDCKFFDRIYFPDQDTGILLDNYAMVKEFNNRNYSTFTKALELAITTIIPNLVKVKSPPDDSAKLHLKACLTQALST